MVKGIYYKEDKNVVKGGGWRSKGNVQQEWDRNQYLR